MSMCYLCDMCANFYEWMDFGYDGPTNWQFECLTDISVHRKKTINYGRDDPKEICKHFEPKEGNE